MIHFAILVLLYFLPTMIAAQRGHSTAVIGTLNLLFGWTGIGWLALMLWAVLARPRFYRLSAQAAYGDGYWTRW